ncbi:hypothetical protein L1D32_15840 [Shewanella insulae]|uniref:hypothetical protein n=1 Tax=Shewanella insulae TaxID=2681496 RepID=UPI001EFE24FB|nr:hypothetical protein [Shewanella insulae]MCG9739635.1 hypothetical protein [Shewanella insulae]
MKQFKSMVFSDENDIYMALHSNKSKVSEPELRTLAFSRGVVYPSKLGRDELIDNISDLPFSYSQLQRLTNRLTPKVNRDQYSVKRIYGKFDFTELPDVINKVRAARPRTIGTEHIKHQASIGQFFIEVEYTEFDFTKGKFQQKRRHAGYIQFISHDETFTSIRYTFTPRIESILQEILAEYKLIKDVNIDITNVDLSSVVSPQLRNEFIDKLLTVNKDFIFLGLDKVRVSKVETISDEGSKPKKIGVVDDIVDSLDQDLMDEDGKLAESDHLSDKDVDKDVDKDHYISDASFIGKGLSDCEQVEDLCRSGFYMSRIKWHSKVKFLKDNPVVSFELAFHEKYIGKTLKFRILGKTTTDADTGLVVKSPVDGADFDQVIAKLEELLFSSHDQVMKNLGDSDDLVQQEAS